MKAIITLGHLIIEGFRSSENLVLFSNDVENDVPFSGHFL